MRITARFAAFYLNSLTSDPYKSTLILSGLSTAWRLFLDNVLGVSFESSWLSPVLVFESEISCGESLIFVQSCNTFTIMIRKTVNCPFIVMNTEIWGL
jgi:hypothetical protein